MTVKIRSYVKRRVSEPILDGFHGLSVCKQKTGTTVAQMTCIVLNSSLSDLARKIYLAHELGHSVLHISEGIERIADFVMLDNTDTLEVEANLFAAELLLGDSDDVMDDLKTYRMTYFQYAAMRNVPYELLAYKIRIMRHQDYRLRELPITPESRFLSRVKGRFSTAASTAFRGTRKSCLSEGAAPKTPNSKKAR